jgi:predicted esterase
MTILRGLLDDISGPHRDQPVLAAGAPLDQAAAAVILLHGRGSSADDIVHLGEAIGVERAAYLAPQAAGHTWYPRPFLAPIPENEPALSSALAVIESLLKYLGSAGMPIERTAIGGFSQGACLSTEFAARHARRYGGVIALSGGLIGPPGTPRDYSGSLDATPIFIGCSDIDPHIPLARVDETAAVFTGLGGLVVKRIYPGMGHAINADEIGYVRNLLATITSDVPLTR